MAELDEWEMEEAAAQILRQATTGREARAAFLMWVKAARLQLAPGEERAKTAVPDAIIAALEALDFGSTLDVLKAERRTKLKYEGPLTLAKGRAVAAVALFKDVQLPVEEAMRKICALNGMEFSSLENIRKKLTSAGKLNGEIKKVADAQLSEWRDLRADLQKVGLQSKFSEIIGQELLADRPLFDPIWRKFSLHS